MYIVRNGMHLAIYVVIEQVLYLHNLKLAYLGLNYGGWRIYQYNERRLSI